MAFMCMVPALYISVHCIFQPEEEQEAFSIHALLCTITGIFVSKKQALKAQLRVPGSKPARGKVLKTYLSSLRQERDGRGSALVCLAARSNQIRSDPPPAMLGK